MTQTPRKTAAKKAPADRRKPAANRTTPASTTKNGNLVATLRGIEWEIDPDTMDDFELLDDINALDQRSDASRMPSVLRRFLTLPDKDGDPDDSQFRKAMDVLRDKKTGRVSIEAGSEFVWDLMEELNPNSSSS